jgi:hypothetical protein
MLYQLCSVFPAANRNAVSLQDSSVKKVHEARNAAFAKQTMPDRLRIPETPKIRRWGKRRPRSEQVAGDPYRDPAGRSKHNNRASFPQQRIGRAANLSP